MRKRWDEIIDRLPSPDAVLVEVGVWQGAISLRLLQRCPRLRLVLVDPWLDGARNASWLASGSQMARESAQTIEAHYQRVVAATAPYGDRVRILRQPSIEAAAQIPDGSCDAVFIDANHAHESVIADVTAWRPKVRDGGWIGGHDYDYPRSPGVKRAVHELLSDVALGQDWTWFSPVRVRS